MVSHILLVSLGGFFGAIARYFFYQYFARFKLFPWGTFLVNTSGSFLMGLLLGSVWISDSTRILVGTGFLGAYTTFSTFNFELFILKKNHREFQFYLYIASSYFFGILLAFLGFSITNGKISVILTSLLMGYRYLL
jgi:fluoride exporter